MTEVPLNVLIQLQGTAAAYVATAETKQAYDNIAPPGTLAPAQAAVPPPRQQPLPRPQPLGEPISAGRRIDPDPDKYVIDTSVSKRVNLRRPV